MGEIHPEVLSNFRIEEPVSAAELELEALFQGR
jgi:phenylalanyl-tRNA synthetase beta subunit